VEQFGQTILANNVQSICCNQRLSSDLRLREIEALCDRICCSADIAKMLCPTVAALLRASRRTSPVRSFVIRGSTSCTSSASTGQGSFLPSWAVFWLERSMPEESHWQLKFRLRCLVGGQYIRSRTLRLKTRPRAEILHRVFHQRHVTVRCQLSQRSFPPMDRAVFTSPCRSRNRQSDYRKSALDIFQPIRLARYRNCWR